MCGKNSHNCNAGFTLVELIIVIGVIGILLSVAWFQFSAYSKKSQMERQVRMLYGDLMEARAKAMFEKRVMTLTFSGNGYSIAADGVVRETKKLFHSITWNNTYVVTYGTDGLLVSAPVGGKTICLSQENESSVDAVVISMTRVQIGKKKEGADCVAGNIVAQ